MHDIQPNSDQSLLDDQGRTGATIHQSPASLGTSDKRAARDKRYLRVLCLYSSGASGKEVATELGVSVARAHQLRQEAIRRASQALKVPVPVVAYLFYPRPHGIIWNEVYDRYSATAVSLANVVALKSWRDSVEAICCAMHENAHSDPLDDLRAFQRGDLTSPEMRAVWYELSDLLRTEPDPESLLNGSFWLERNGEGAEFPKRFGDPVRYKDFLDRLKRRRVTWQRLCEALHSVRYDQAHISKLFNSTWHELMFESEKQS